MLYDGMRFQVVIVLLCVAIYVCETAEGASRCGIFILVREATLTSM